MNRLFRFAQILLLTFPLAASAADKVVVYNWSEYVPEEVLERFTEETGIEVVYSTYESNEVMYSKLQLQNNQGYDVVFPSTYYVAKMAGEGRLRPLEKDKLPNLASLDPTLLDKAYDPGNRFSLPYFWGSTGIGVNADEIDPSTIRSWKQLWEPQYKRQLLLTDDVREVFHVALSINGHSPNTTDPVEIGQAYELLKGLMPNVLVFNSDAPREPFLAGDVSLGMIWNGEVVMAQEEDDAIRYVYPDEGAVFWVDSYVIPAGAENVDEAHRFIDFMMRPEIAQACVEYVGYATPNKAALELLDEETRNNPVIFPPAEVVENGEFQTDVGEAIELYNKYWEMLKVGR
ncbi:MAG: extracellular solute-binding protein [Xanthomonadales bacterium]|jgi:spermidine/putrescine transport system substrate-binding protein|nr:extracellular solute-binding protein [Xanthomonadales bacterium]